MSGSPSVKLELGSRLMRNQEIFASEIDNELVMMDDTQGMYFGLNSVARKVWELLDSPKSYESLLNLLLDSYEVELKQCQQDVEPFLLKMIEHRLVRIVPE